MIFQRLSPGSKLRGLPGSTARSLLSFLLPSKKNTSACFWAPCDADGSATKASRLIENPTENPTENPVENKAGYDREKCHILRGWKVNHVSIMAK